MKLSKVIFGVDDSYFLEFWPLQSKICKEILGLEPVLFYISEEESDFYHDGNGLVKKIKKVGNKNTGLLACIVRLFGTKYFPDEVCITGDLDMLMINKEYFINQVEKFDENSLVIYTSDAYDLNRPEAQQLFENEPFPFKQEMYNYPYYAAKGDTFTKVIDNLCSFEEFVYRHETYKPGYNFMWMIDEFYFSDCVNNKEHGVEVHKLKRGYTTPWMASRRIDRHNFPVKLQWQNEIDMQNKYGIYDKQKLIDGYYIDVNCCRPYSNYKKEIDELVDIVMKRKNTKKLIIEERTELCDIMDKHGSDKASKPTWVDYLGHNYTRYYSQLFEEIRHDNIKIFELGLGTNNVNIPSNMGSLGTPGASLRGWKEYFINGEIYGADIDKKILFNDERIKTFYCDQTNNDDIQKMWDSINQNFDIIIDDGLHQFDANLNFLKNSIHFLNVNGFYIVEDVTNNELELWKNEIENLKKLYENFLFSIIELEWTHDDNNLIVIKKINEVNKNMEENNLIKFIGLNKENFHVYFKYLGTIPTSGRVRLSWRGLTIYHANFEFHNDESITYYISLNDEKIWEFVDFMDLIVETKFGIKSFSIKSSENSANYPFLDNLSTEKYDTCFYTFEEIFLKKVYQNNIVRVNSGDTVVDIGANYGFFIESILNEKPSQIHCFEPTPIVFKNLVKNYSKNDNVSFYNAAVSSKNGVVKFHDSISSASNHISDTNEGYDVDSIDINTLVENISKKIDFLKIDCEGCEKDIFETISSENLKKIEKIVVEYHTEEIKKIIIDRLNSEGFVIEDISNSIIFSYKGNPRKKTPKKKVILISTFCDTEKKISVLKENLKILKNLGIDIMIIVPNFLPVDEEIIKLSDFVFYTKENPLLKYPIRQYTHWYEQPLSDEKIITLHRGFADYGWAALYQTKKLSQLALTFDYDLFYHLIYDVEIDNILISELLSDNANIIHPRRNPNHPEEIWETTLHFMVFDREMMQKIEKEITLDEYLSTNGVAEGEVLKWTKKFDLKISEHCVKDKIFYWENFDFFNVSPYPEFKMFLSKNPELEIWIGQENPKPVKLTTNLRIVFYGIPENFEIKVLIEGQEFNLKPINWEFIELPIDSQSIKEMKFEYNGSEIDFSKEYSNTMMNQVFYNFRN